jgi:hypothetical protein
VLPPRVGGPVALLDPLTPADIIIVAHTGFGATAHVKDFMRGEMVGTTIKVHFWRHSGADVPDDDDGRIHWLFDRWEEVDDWIHHHGRS